MRVRPAVQRIMDAMVLTPAFVVDSRLDILAANELGRALYAPILADPTNHARFLFLNRHAGDFWRDWNQAAGVEAVGWRSNRPTARREPRRCRGRPPRPAPLRRSVPDFEIDIVDGVPRQTWRPILATERHRQSVSVEKHITNIPPDDDVHRRVRTVLAFLNQ
jgi:hypothetical protein